MRIDCRFRVPGAILAALLLAGSGLAQDTPLAITAVGVGFPPGPPPPGTPPTAPARPVLKFATWAPLYVHLEVRQEVREPVELVVETPDIADVTTSLAVPLPAVNAAHAGQVLTGRDFPVMPYVRLASAAAEITLRLRTTGGTELAEPFRVRNVFATSARSYVVLSLGNGIPGFDLPKDSSSDASTPRFRNGRVETASIISFDDLPDRWFGYDAADLVVLATGSATREFLDRFFGDAGPPTDRKKREALLEWVRRGGRLVLSVGHHAESLATYPAFREFLPFALPADAPVRREPSLFFRWRSAGGTPQSATFTSPHGPLPVPNFAPRPERPTRVLIEDRPGGDVAGRPIAGQTALGLGRVSVLAFDLDLPPFTEYPLRSEFWDWVLRECGSSMASAGGEGKSWTAAEGLTSDEDNLAAALRTHVDTFPDVPVISFGWVAVFIALYLLLIGPIEYFLLKNLLGRLELTWITFPIIVLSVCAAAYLTAFALKGDAIRVNKVDVVEVNAADGRVFGHSWFTLFSPRIDTYTVTVSPSAGWTGENVEQAARETLTGWTGDPRGGRASLVRRGYRYHVNADGSRLADALEDVPLQMWSTRTFSSRWAAPFDPRQPVVESKLTHPPGDPSAVVGSLVNRMPLGELQDVIVIYGGQAYPTALGTLVPGVERQLVLRDKPSNTWLAAEGEAAERLLGLGRSRGVRANIPSDAAPVIPGVTPFPMLSLFFHEAATRKDEGVTLQNASLRSLDQSWRLNAEHRDEVIVVGRLAVTTGPAEEVFGPRYSPSQLWLRGMPGDGRERTPLTGAGRQETYVRLYLPVK